MLLGCFGDAPRPHFAGTDHETSWCPRKLVILNSDIVVEAIDLWSSCEGRVGVDGRAALSGQGADAMATINDGRAWRTEDEFNRQQTEAKREQPNRDHDIRSRRRRDKG